MIGLPSPLFAKGDAAPPPVIGPIDPATLFGSGELGAYYNFTAASTLAVNADGTGGAPAVGATCRSVLDLSPNGNRLNNAANTATRRANGVETSGTSDGLINANSWPTINPPHEVVISFEQIAHAGVDKNIMSGGTWQFIQRASGKVALFNGSYGPDIDAPIGVETIADLITPGGQPLFGMIIGSNFGGTNPTQVRFKHLLIIARALTTTEREGVTQWMQA